MYILNNQGNYICRGSDDRLFLSKNINKAVLFKTRERAANTLLNLPKALKENNFEIETFNPIKDEELQMLKNNVNVLALHSSDIDQYQKQIREQLSTIDLELTDIDHYIEFNKLSASDGYKIFKLRQNKLKKRREIKDALYTCSLLKKHSLESKKIIKEINCRERRKYTPRVMNELFGS